MRSRKNEKFDKFLKSATPDGAYVALYFPEVVGRARLDEWQAGQIVDRVRKVHNARTCPICGDLMLADHSHYKGAVTIRDELVAYSNDVWSGTVPACKKHKWACKRFLDDLATDGPFRFDEGRALDFIRWNRLFKHREGVLAGQHIEPHIIVKFIFGNVYGWLNKDTGYRRFSKMYWQVARKNAKSQSLSAVGSYETMVFFRGKETAKVFCAATKTEQARIVYDEAVAMLGAVPALRSAYEVKYGRITHTATGSVMKVLSEEDRKTGDGLNPQCGIIDEYHAHETAEVYDILDSGTDARAQSLIPIITTAGFDYASPCYRVEYPLCSDILNPDSPVKIENYFVMINELEKNETSEPIEVDGKKIGPGDLIDDINNPHVWPKASPVVCSYDVGVQNLVKKLRIALVAPEKMRNFLTKNMNVWVNRSDFGYMDLSKWSACAALRADLPDVHGLGVVTGLDLSSTIDLASVSFVNALPDGFFRVQHHSWVPEATFEKRKRTDKMPFELWEKQGYLTVTPGAEIQYSDILDYIVEQYEANAWTRGELCFDRALATWLMQAAENLEFLPVQIPQSFTGLSFAVKSFRAKVLNGKIIHDGDPLLSWAIGNAITRSGPSENIMLDKSKSRDRIDPLAATVNAMARALVTEEKEEYVYNSRGMRSFL